MPCIGRDVDCAAGPDRRGVIVDLHLPSAANDVVGFLGFVVVKQELRAGRELCNARDETDAFRAFARDQELPAYRALGSEGGVAPAFPIEGGLVDYDRFARVHRPTFTGNLSVNPANLHNRRAPHPDVMKRVRLLSSESPGVSRRSRRNAYRRRGASRPRWQN